MTEGVRPDCYRCKWRDFVSERATFSCKHPTLVPLTQAGIDTLGIKVVYSGVVQGQFDFPRNFNPQWLAACNGFEQREGKRSQITKLQEHIATILVNNYSSACPACGAELFCHSPDAVADKILDLVKEAGYVQLAEDQRFPLNPYATTKSEESKMLEVLRLILLILIKSLP